MIFKFRDNGVDVYCVQYFRVSSVSMNCYLLFLILATASVGCTSGDSQRVATPAVTCREAAWDVGEVSDHELSALTHSFVLKSHTNQELSVSVDADCGCLTTNFPEVILPGKEAVIETRLALSPEDTGPFHRSLRVDFANDVESFSLKLLIRGIVKPSARLVANPNVYQIGGMHANKQVSRTVRIHRIDNSPISFTKCSTSIPGAAVSCELKDGGSIAEVSLNLRGLEVEATALRRPVVIVTTDHPQFATLEIPVDWTLISSEVPIRSAIVLEQFEVGSARKVSFLSPNAVVDEGFEKRVQLHDMKSSPQLIVNHENLVGGEIEIALSPHAQSNSVHKAMLQWIVDGSERPVSTTIVVFSKERVD